jgi:hydroxyethylthiazole kinase
MKPGIVTAGLAARVRAEAPLVHNITNFVVMNSSANILLAAGASPVMAHAPEEAAEMAGMAGALVLNIGTLAEPWVEAMLLAGQAANRRDIPVILDPVGAGATAYRTETCRRLLRGLRISVLRGNASEIASVTGAPAAATRGVDAAGGVTPALVSAAGEFALREGCVVGISGEKDLVTDGRRTFRIANGHPLMTRVTGMGCGLSAVTGAFCAVARGNVPPVEAVTAAFAFYGLCGEIAERAAPAPGSFLPAFLDVLHTVSAATIEAGVRVEEV